MNIKNIMKLPISGRKKLIFLLILSSALCAVSALWLGVRVLDITDLLHSAGSPSSPAPASPPEGNGEKTKPDAGKKPAPIPAGEKGKKPEPPPSGEKGKKTPAEQPREIPIIPSDPRELPVTTPATSGIVRVTSVQLPPSAMDWTKKGLRPRPGDVIRVNVPQAREYLIKVQSFEVTAEDGMTVLGRLLHEEGEASMLAVGDKMSVQIVDRTQRRVYNLYYNIREKTYTVVEIDPSLIPPASY